MSAIRSRGNKSTELALIKLMRKEHVSGWTRNSKRLFGKPDFIFKSHRIAVFVDGCFWHGCRDIRKLPAANRIFWLKKIERNRTRDIEVNKMLKKQGWYVVRIWEHDLKHNKKRVVTRIIKAVSSAI